MKENKRLRFNILKLEKEKMEQRSRLDPEKINELVGKVLIRDVEEDTLILDSDFSG